MVVVLVEVSDAISHKIGAVSQLSQFFNSG